MSLLQSIDYGIVMSFHILHTAMDALCFVNSDFMKFLRLFIVVSNYTSLQNSMSLVYRNLHIQTDKLKLSFTLVIIQTDSQTYKNRPIQVKQHNKE